MMVEFPPVSAIAPAHVFVAPTATTMEIENSMVGETLVLGSACTAECKVTLKGKNVPYQKKGTNIELPTVELLRRIPPGESGALAIKNGGITRTIKIKRKTLLPPTLADLTPLYQQMAKEIKEKGYFTVTIPIVLWDASFTGEGFLKEGKRSLWADGTDPKTNLNWGSGSGVYHLLRYHEKSWKLVFEETNSSSPIKRVVFAKQVPPSPFWKKQGTDKPFTVYLVLLAYNYNDILEGYRYFGKLAQGEATETIPLPNGPTLALSESRVVGMATHYIPEGLAVIPQNLKSSQPKGIFMASCFSSPEYGSRFIGGNLYPLFFSTPTTSSEGFVYLPIVEGLIKGRDLKGLLQDVAKSIQNYHPDHYPGPRQYNNPSTPFFERSISRYALDWDGDLIWNNIDPEPNTPNPSKIDVPTQKIVIIQSNGTPLIIDPPIGQK